MRILVVEDEVKIAHAMKRALELQTYAVDVANSGTDGLELSLGEQYNLMIFDVMLPGITGFELCKKVRAEGIHTPILMLTAKDQIEDKVIGLDSGADDYMVKPFSFEELFARVRALVRRPTQTTESILEIADLTLDPTTFKVKRGDKMITLSTKEFALLEYLMRHKNTVLTRDQIINHVWNYDANVLPSTVEVHVKHLRDKVDTPFAKQLIKTVRGFGYEIGEGG